MTNDTIEVKSTPTKAFRELTEKFDLHTTRLRLIEQQFLDLAVRVNYIEDARRK